MSREQPIYLEHIVYSEEPDENGNYIAGLDESATPEMIEAFYADKEKEKELRSKGIKI
ncbi:MAG: hypothetical protein ACI4I1_08770 [Oscillospiraceae bacterium]